MDCRDFENNMIFFFDKEISKQAAAEFQNHINVCKNCANLYAEFSESMSVIETEKLIEVSGNFTKKVMSEIKQPSIAPTKKIIMYSAAAAVALFFFVVGLSGGNYLMNFSSETGNYQQTEIYYINDLQQESAESVLLNNEILSENE